MKQHFDQLVVTARMELSLLSQLYTATNIDIHKLLTPNELDTLSKTMLQRQAKQISLDYSSFEIKITRTRTDYFALIQIPILDEQDLATVYQVVSLPSFHEGKQYYQRSSHDYVSVYQFRPFFIPMDLTEIQKCLSKGVCSPTSPLVHKDTKFCVLGSFFKNQEGCPFFKSNSNVPFAKTMNEHTFLVSDVPVEFALQCKRLNNIPHNYPKIEYEGLLKLKIPESCEMVSNSISLVPSTTIRDITYYENDDIEIEYKTFESDLPSNLKISLDEHTPHRNKNLPIYEEAHRGKNDTSIWSVAVLTLILTLIQLAYTAYMNIAYYWVKHKKSDIVQENTHKKYVDEVSNDYETLTKGKGE